MSGRTLKQVVLSCMRKQSFNQKTQEAEADDLCEAKVNLSELT